MSLRDGQKDDMVDKNEDCELMYSDDSGSDTYVELENKYFYSKCLKEESTKDALKSFEDVITLQGENKGEWGFRALKQMVKINFKLKQYDEMMQRYKDLLSYIKHSVTKNHFEKSINSIIEYTASSKNIDLLHNFYKTTLEALKCTMNERLWFNTNAKLGKLYLERREFIKLQAVIKQLYQSCKDVKENDGDIIHGTQLLEIYTLEIQMHTEQKNINKLKELYERSLRIRSAILHPLSMSVIRECGGKMYFESGDFEKAYKDFFEAFKNYAKSSDPRQVTCLKYLILTCLLMNASISPFDYQEAKPYINHPEIQAMTSLIEAYQNFNIHEFETILRNNKTSLFTDHFIKEHIENLQKSMRIQILTTLVVPYRNIKMVYISSELGIELEETENFVTSCILDGVVKGKIDQMQGILFLEDQEKKQHIDRYKALEKLVNAQMSLLNKLTRYKR